MLTAREITRQVADEWSIPADVLRFGRRTRKNCMARRQAMRRMREELGMRDGAIAIAFGLSRATVRAHLGTPTGKVHQVDLRNRGWRWTPEQAEMQLARAYAVQHRGRE